MNKFVLALGALALGMGFFSITPSFADELVAPHEEKIKEMKPLPKEIKEVPEAPEKPVKKIQQVPVEKPALPDAVKTNDIHDEDIRNHVEEIPEHLEEHLEEKAAH